MSSLNPFGDRIPAKKRRGERPLVRLRRMSPRLFMALQLESFDLEQAATFVRCLLATRMPDAVPDAVAEEALRQRRDPIQDFDECAPVPRIIWRGYVAEIGLKEREGHPIRSALRRFAAARDLCRPESPRELAVYRALGLLRRVLAFAQAAEA